MTRLNQLKGDHSRLTGRIASGLEVTTEVIDELRSLEAMITEEETKDTSLFLTTINGRLEITVTETLDRLMASIKGIIEDGIETGRAIRVTVNMQDTAKELFEDGDLDDEDEIDDDPYNLKANGYCSSQDDDYQDGDYMWVETPGRAMRDPYPVKSDEELMDELVRDFEYDDEDDYQDDDCDGLVELEELLGRIDDYIIETERLEEADRRYEYPANIMKTLRKDLELSPETIEDMTQQEVFAAVLEYEGIIGYDDWILDRIRDVYGRRP